MKNREKAIEDAADALDTLADAAEAARDRAERARRNPDPKWSTVEAWTAAAQRGPSYEEIAAARVPVAEAQRRGATWADINARRRRQG